METDPALAIATCRVPGVSALMAIIHPDSIAFADGSLGSQGVLAIFQEDRLRNALVFTNLPGRFQRRPPGILKNLADTDSATPDGNRIVASSELADEARGDIGTLSTITISPVLASTDCCRALAVSVVATDAAARMADAQLPDTSPRSTASKS